MHARWFSGFLVLVAGCNGSPVAPVSGRVTLDGAPLANAIVLFQPIHLDKDNTGMGSTGKTDADGRYTLQQIQPRRMGATIGKHRVSITMAPVPGESEVHPSRKPIPAIYNLKTELDCDVPPGGKSDADFDLLSNPKSCSRSSKYCLRQSPPP
jgi:hypothetical protein